MVVLHREGNAVLHNCLTEEQYEGRNCERIRVMTHIQLTFYIFDQSYSGGGCHLDSRYCIRVAGCHNVL